MNLDDFPFDKVIKGEERDLTIIKKVCLYVLKGKAKDDAVSFEDSGLIVEAIKTYCALGFIKGMQGSDFKAFYDYDDLRIAYFRKHRNGDISLAQYNVHGNGELTGVIKI